MMKTGRLGLWPFLEWNRIRSFACGIFSVCASTECSLTVYLGFWYCRVGLRRRAAMRQTHQWSVKRDVFERTYQPWDSEESPPQVVERLLERIEKIRFTLDNEVFNAPIVPNPFGGVVVPLSQQTLAKLRRLVEGDSDA